MTIKDILPKLHPSCRAYIVILLKWVMSIQSDEHLEEGIPSLDKVFSMLGKNVTRRAMLKDIQDRISYNMGYSFIIPKIDEIQGLIDTCDKQTKLCNDMAQAILQKEIPYVKDDSKSLDVPIEQ